MDLHLAEISRTIDPVELGRRLRTARVAAGMTQAQVAADDVTAAYLSRIEDGQRRPEAGLLERMAHRMGVTLEDVLLAVPREKALELRLAVDHAELALASGDATGALAAAEEVLADAATADIPALLRAARQVQAGALEITGDLDRAILILHELTSTPSPDATWLKSLIALSRCHRLAGDYARAVNVGEQAQAIIDELGIGGLPEAIQLTVTTAGAYHAQGDLGQAMRICLRALDDAERYDSPVGKASAYWNASIVEATRGATAAAIDLARKALAVFEASDDRRTMARLRATVANMHLVQDPPAPEAALDILATLDPETAWPDATAWDISCMHLVRGKAKLLLGDLDAAIEGADLTMATRPAGAPTLEANSLVLRGRVAIARGDRDVARRHFQTAVHALTATGADRSAAQLWFELADLLAEVGDHEGAVGAFRSAGASTGLHLPTRSGAALPESR